MKILIISLFLFLLTNHNAFSQTINPEYDKALADSLGADDNGMKSYVLVILRTGPAVIEDKEYQQIGKRKKTGSCRTIWQK